MDVSGAEPSELSVVAEEMKVRVSGERVYPLPEKICCIHQLEIERGYFERIVSLPRAVDVSKTSSAYKNGMLVITLPIWKHKGKARIKVT
jgi:HSP20 family molecular chaperone IbpA